MSTITKEFTKEQLPDDRLVKILSETQAVVTEHNSRCVRGSVEVDARLFESMLVEIQLRRHLMEQQAAMLQGADGNSPVIPDGWIPVSERMPGSQEWVIVFAKWDNQQVLCWDDVANRWTDFEDQSYYADMFTHWMPLPAAPQQEGENV